MYQNYSVHTSKERKTLQMAIDKSLQKECVYGSFRSVIQTSQYWGLFYIRYHLIWYEKMIGFPDFKVSLEWLKKFQIITQY